MVVNVAASFISDIVPICGMWNVNATAPTSVVLPAASVNDTVNSAFPCLSTPSFVASETVRLFPAGALLMTLGSVGLSIVSVAILRRQLALFTAVMASGAVAWLVGQLLWLMGWPIHRVVFWWIAFLVLTIAGERLEMARLLRLSRASQVVFAVLIAVFIAGVALATVAFDPGVRVVGLGLVSLTLWLGFKDIARRTVRQPGLTRFIALCLLSGYVWLGVGGLLALFSDGAAAGPRYDALLHALFLGFVFAMIFGHAPIIFPAVLGVAVSFRPAFYAHLAFLHVTLLLRITGDLLPSPPARQWGGLLNVLALLLFLANTGYGVLKPVRRP